MEYYCKKGRAEEIRDIIDVMPVFGSQQGFLYYTQAYINANNMEKAAGVLDTLMERRIVTRLPFELLIKEFSKRKDWDAVYQIVDKMEEYGFRSDLESLAKLEGIHKE